MSYVLVSILENGVGVVKTALAKETEGDISKIRGYTLSHLETIGIDKATLNKAVKLGMIKRTHVRESDGQVRLFYYTELRTANSKA